MRMSPWIFTSELGRKAVDSWHGEVCHGNTPAPQCLGNCHCSIIFWERREAEAGLHIRVPEDTLTGSTSSDVRVPPQHFITAFPLYFLPYSILAPENSLAPSDLHLFSSNDL